MQKIFSVTIFRENLLPPTIFAFFVCQKEQESLVANNHRYRTGLAGAHTFFSPSRGPQKGQKLRGRSQDSGKKIVTAKSMNPTTRRPK